MTEELLSADAAGRVRVIIGRASDYFGPGTRSSALGETVFGPALAGRTAQVMGDPDQPHSYSFVPDVAEGLITLGAAPNGTGQIWHLPVAEPCSTRTVVATVYALAGRRLRLMAANRTTLRAVGLVKPAMREYLHTLYQFTEPWVVDDSKFRSAFGNLSTPLPDALARTLAWYRDPSAPSALQPSADTVHRLPRSQP
jgi:nucleoside-diphosphate-sugar epimerase